MSGRPKRNGLANAGPFALPQQDFRKGFARPSQVFARLSQVQASTFTCEILAYYLPTTCETLAKYLPNSTTLHTTTSTTLCGYASLAYTASNRHASGTTQCASDITSLRCSGITTLLGFAAGMVLPAPGGAAHLSEMLPLPARTSPPTPSLGEAERTQCN